MERRRATWHSSQPDHTIRVTTGSCTGLFHSHDSMKIHESCCGQPFPHLFITPHSSLLTPHSSLITPHSSLITHHSSLITHHSSLIIHHSSLLTHHSSLLTPHSSLITPHSSLSFPHCLFMGSVTMKVDPSPGLLCASMAPPCLSTIFLQMARPIPVPSY